MHPIVSIIIPCYNHGVYLKETLQSIALVTDKELYEIIIVNDGSTDALTINVLKELEREGFLVYHQHNMGLGAARNNGIKLAKGKYILPLDADNKIKPGYLTEAVKLLENDAALSVVYADAEYFGDKTGIFQSGEFNLQRLMIENYIDACAVFRKTDWEQAGGYDEKMPVMGYEDWDFWLRLAFKNKKFRYIHAPMFYYRYYQASMIRSVDDAEYSAIMEYMQKKHHGFLNTAYINQLIYYKLLTRKSLARYVFMRSFFPRITNLLRKTGLLKHKDLL